MCINDIFLHVLVLILCSATLMKLLIVPRYIIMNSCIFYVYHIIYV